MRLSYLPRFLVLSGVLALGALGPAACLEPTQITVRVETDMTCGQGEGELQSVLVGAGGTESVSITPQSACADQFVGSVAVVPGTGAGAVDITVVGTIGGSKCAIDSPNGNGCVATKRRLSFIDHIPLSITIRIESECAGVTCTGNQTCSAGKCVDPGCGSSCGDAGGDGGGGGPRITAITSGGNSTCATTTAGDVVCWGDAQSRKLFVDANAIPPTKIPELAGAKNIVLGRAHGCATFTDPNGDVVKCWGANDKVQAGHPDMPVVTVPNPVIDGTTAKPLTGVLALAAGDDFTCALTASKTVACWGASDQGQLGFGAMANLSKAKPVPNLVNPTAIAAGSTHACAVAQLSGNNLCTSCGVVCWGSNKDGQVTGTPDSVLTPRAVQLPAPRGLFAGGNRSLVTRAPIVVQNGATAEALYWGRPVGDLPVAVGPTLIPAFGKVEAASSGLEHACLLNAARPYCKAADPAFLNFNSKVPSTLEFGAITSGWEHTCVVSKIAGQAWCFGKNDAFRLGGAAAQALQSPNRVDLPK